MLPWVKPALQHFFVFLSLPSHFSQILALHARSHQARLIVRATENILTLQRGRNNEGNKFGGVLLAARSTKAACTPPPLMFSSTSSRATHLFLSCVVTRALILFFFCLQRKMPRTPSLKFAPTRGEDKPPPDRMWSDSRPAGKCFKEHMHVEEWLTCHVSRVPPPLL